MCLSFCYIVLIALITSGTGIGDEGATALADLRVIKNFAKLK